MPRPSSPSLGCGGIRDPLQPGGRQRRWRRLDSTWAAEGDAERRAPSRSRPLRKSPRSVPGNAFRFRRTPRGAGAARSRLGPRPLPGWRGRARLPERDDHVRGDRDGQLGRAGGRASEREPDRKSGPGHGDRDPGVLERGCARRRRGTFGSGPSRDPADQRTLDRHHGRHPAGDHRVLGRLDRHGNRHRQRRSVSSVGRDSGHVHRRRSVGGSDDHRKRHLVPGFDVHERDGEQRAARARNRGDQRRGRPDRFAHVLAARRQSADRDRESRNGLSRQHRVARLRRAHHRALLRPRFVRTHDRRNARSATDGGVSGVEGSGVVQVEGTF